MQALAVVESFDVVPDGLSGLGLILELPVSDQLVLQRTEEAFHRRVVVTIAFATRTGDDPAPGQHRLIERGPILVAVIAMMHEPWGRASGLPAIYHASTTTDRDWREL